MKRLDIKLRVGSSILWVKLRGPRAAVLSAFLFAWNSTWTHSLLRIPTSKRQTGGHFPMVWENRWAEGHRVDLRKLLPQWQENIASRSHIPSHHLRGTKTGVKSERLSNYLRKYSQHKCLTETSHQRELKFGKNKCSALNWKRQILSIGKFSMSILPSMLVCGVGRYEKTSAVIDPVEEVHFACTTLLEMFLWSGHRRKNLLTMKAIWKWKDQQLWELVMFLYQGCFSWG